MAIQTVSKKDDPCSQRHELLGVKNIYKEFDSKNVKVRLHGHDRNASVNKYLMKEQPEVKNGNDTWHATKGIVKALKGITTGPKKESWKDMACRTYGQSSGNKNSNISRHEKL